MTRPRDMSNETVKPDQLSPGVFNDVHDEVIWREGPETDLWDQENSSTVPKVNCFQCQNRREKINVFMPVFLESGSCLRPRLI